MYVIKTEEMRVPLKVWQKQGAVDNNCIEQMTRLTTLPFVGHHIALMPDAHLGIGASIGSVAPLKNVIIPSLIGVDIGCGVCSLQTDIKDFDRESLIKVLKIIRELVPVGFNRHKSAMPENLMPKIENITYEVAKHYNAARSYIGTLGGGNHFIELQKNSKNELCIMIHSGSRNLGKQIADFYNKAAKSLNEKYFSSVPLNWDLAFFPLDDELGKLYLAEMDYCVEFALANRMAMMDVCREALLSVFQGFGEKPLVNIAHNYAEMENHFGQNVMVHRKGATLAREGFIGLIPGSQGTKSYMVRGKGNKESFMSCSHGAGRKMGRKVAQKTLDLDAEKRKLEEMGVIHAIRNEKDLDEAPGSYKDIDLVMKEQSDLVDIVEEFTPLAVIKG